MAYTQITVDLLYFDYMYINGKPHSSIPNNSPDFLLKSDFQITVENTGTSVSGYNSNESTYCCGQHTIYKVKILKPNYKFTKFTQDMANVPDWVKGTYGGCATGTYIDKDGQTVTNGHLFYTSDNGKELTVIFDSMQQFNARGVNFRTNLISYTIEKTPITTTLQGLTADSNNSTEYSPDTDTVLLFTVNNDYKDPVVTATYTNSAGTQTINGVVDGNTVTLTIPSGITGITSGINVNGTATEIFVDNIPIAFNLTGCSSTGIQTYSSKSDADTTIRLTADSGFTFREVPTGSFKYSNSTNQLDFTLSENNTIATVTLPHGMDTVSDITVNAVATANVETADIVYSLNHCSNNGVTKYSSDKQSEIVLTAENGFEFTSQPTAVYTANGLSKTIKGVISDNKLTATITLQSGITGITTDISVTGNATAIVVPVTHTVHYTLSNCTSSGETTYYDNTDLVITLTADTGYVFKVENLPRAYWHSAIQGDNAVNATLQNEGKNAVITIPSGISYEITNDTIEITGTAESDGSNHTHDILYTLSNAKHNNVTQYTDNGTINIVLTADPDCLFSADNKPKIHYTYIQDNPYTPTVGVLRTSHCRQTVKRLHSL